MMLNFYQVIEILDSLVLDNLIIVMSEVHKMFRLQHQVLLIMLVLDILLIMLGKARIQLTSELRIQLISGILPWEFSNLISLKYQCLHHQQSLLIQELQIRSLVYQPLPKPSQEQLKRIKPLFKIKMQYKNLTKTRTQKQMRCIDPRSNPQTWRHTIETTQIHSKLQANRDNLIPISDRLKDTIQANCRNNKMKNKKNCNNKQNVAFVFPKKEIEEWDQQFCEQIFLSQFLFVRRIFSLQMCLHRSFSLEISVKKILSDKISILYQQTSNISKYIKIFFHKVINKVQIRRKQMIINVFVFAMIFKLVAPALINYTPEKTKQISSYPSSKIQQKSLDPLFKTTFSQQKLTDLYTKHNAMYSKNSSSTNFQEFQDVRVNHCIPNVFVKGQLFILEGEVIQFRLMQYLIKKQQETLKSNKNYLNIKQYTLNIILMDVNTNERTVFQHSISIQKRKFRSQIIFQKSGVFRLGIMIGHQGSVPTRLYTVVNQSKFVQDLKQMKDMNIVSSQIQVDFMDNQLYIRWVPQTKLTKIRIFQQQTSSAQQNKKKTQENIFIISNDKGQLKLPTQKFKNFKQNQITIQICHAQTYELSSYFQYTRYSDFKSKKINITKHHFLQRKLDILFYKNDQLKLIRSVGELFVLQGICYEEIMIKGLVILPNQSIVQVNLIQNYQQNTQIKYFPAYTQFCLKFILDLEGVYILEINHKDGFAALNIPIYAGPRYPLIPDEIGVYECYTCERTLPNLRQTDLQRKKYQILEQINQIRKKYGANPVKQDPKLSKLAQNHSQDMIRRGYVSHINPEKQGPRARAIRADIYSSIGENIIAQANINLLQTKLNRSPLHLKNTIDKRWTRIGLSLLRNTDQRFYLTEQFSKDQFKPSEQLLLIMKKQIISVLQSKTKQTLTQNQYLSSQLSKWQEKNSPQNTTAVKQFLKTFSIKSASYLKLSLPIESKIKEELNENPNIKNISKKNFGLNIKFQKGQYQVVGIFY